MRKICTYNLPISLVKRLGLQIPHGSRSIFVEKAIENRLNSVDDFSISDIETKTIIAVLSSLQTIESNYQVAIMVPTGILAQQHFETIKNLLKETKIKISILTGKDKGNKRIQKIKEIENGDTNLIIGTHSLIQDDVNFKSIGLVIIDEQHRFGVYQRMAFTNKLSKPSILVMSATPIPRTLTLAAYGDMDESKITEKPKGRLPITTTSGRPATRTS